MRRYDENNTFSYFEVVNRQNYWFWSENNAQSIPKAHTQNPGKVNVWPSVINAKILESYFYEENLTTKPLLCLDI